MPGFPNVGQARKTYMKMAFVLVPGIPCVNYQDPPLSTSLRFSASRV